MKKKAETFSIFFVEDADTGEYLVASRTGDFYKCFGGAQFAQEENARKAIRDYGRQVKQYADLANGLTEHYRPRNLRVVRFDVRRDQAVYL